MWLITKILGVLSGGLLDRTFKYFETKQRLGNDRAKLESEVVLEAIKGEMDSRKLSADIVKIEQGWWVTSMIRPLFAFPFIVYINAIVIVSVFRLKWEVQELPAHVLEWGGWIIGGYFLSRPLEKIARSYIHGRK